MKRLFLYSIILLCTSCGVNEKISDRKFQPTTLINKIEYFDSSKSWDKIGCGFLLEYKKDTFAITAKHILSIAKTDSMKYLTIEDYIKQWSLRPLDKENKSVIISKLINENKSERLKTKEIFVDDWLIFSIKENNSNVRVLKLRDNPIKKGERLYVVGWTRHMTEGEQRVYEFKYYKPKGTHFLMKNIYAPESFGGLSGAPVLDQDGNLVGIFSNGTFEITAMKKLLSPCGIDNLKIFLDNYIDNN